MRWSRLASGGALATSAPRSSSASARSPSLMSTPLTRATTVSDGEAEPSELEFLEQPQTASISAAAVAASTAKFRAGADRRGNWREIMAWSLWEQPSAWHATGAAKSPAWQRIAGDFDENVSAGRPRRAD